MIINRLKNKLPQGFSESKATNLNQYKIEVRSLPLVLKATYYYQERLYGKASELYAEALAIQPDNAYLNFKYGMTFYKRKKWSDAHGFIKKAVELNPHNPEWKKQLSTTSKFVKSPVKSKEIDLKTKVEEKPNDENYISDYAETLFKNKKYWLSKLQYQKLLQITPKSEVALFKVGLIAEKLSNYREALDYFMQVESTNAQNMTYKYHIGLCYEMLGEFEDARIYYGVIEADAGRESATAKYGVGALHAANGHWRLALKNYKFFKDSVDVDATYADVLHYRIGVAYEKLFQWDEAALAYEQALELSDFRPAGWCYKCGEAYEKSGQISEAVEFYREAVSRTSDYKDYWWFRLGSAYEKNASYKEASEAFYESRRRKYLHAVSPKGVIQNKNQDYLSYYTEYYETLKVDKNLVMLESFLASTVSGNPYAILTYMLNQNYDFKYVVVIKENTAIPDSLKFNKNIIFIDRGSDAYLRYLCSAKYLINNVSFPYYFIRKPNQVYLNTWHGTPMKTLGKDIKDPFQDHANVARNFLQATHIISQNRFTSNILLDRYDVKGLFSGKIAETGYPRVDLSLNLDHDGKQLIAKRLGVKLDRPVILYAPTWRGTSETKNFDTDKLKKDLVYLKDRQYQVVFKGHHLAEKLLNDLNISNIIIASKEVDTNELLGITDILISDYSSIIFDFLKLDKPIISYVYDFESYKQERGLYIDKNKMLGDVYDNIKQVKKSIIKHTQNLRSNVESSKIKEFANFDDGNASKRTVDFMFDKDNSNVWKYEKKKQLVFFNGPFIPNGISRSFLNLMSSINHNEFDATVLINRVDIQDSNQRLEEFRRLPDNVKVLARVGTMPMMLEEINIRNIFEKNYKLYSKDYEDKITNLFDREARRLFGDTQIETAVNFEGYALFWVSLVSQINANKKVIFQHNDKMKEWKTRFPYLEGVFKWYKYYDVIASVSQGTMKNNIENLVPVFNLPEDKFTYINNSLNIEQILSGASEDIELEDCFTQFEGVKFISMGRMSHEKDQAKLIEAFAIVKELHSSVRLYILGDGDLRPELEQKIVSLGLVNDVYLLGQKENPFVYLSKADCFALSSNHEGQPMVLLEALTLGLPVIATDIVGNRSVLGDKYGKLVENSKEGLVAGMVSFIEEGAPKIKFDANKYQEEALSKFYSIVTS
ncbi:CDP-glycerol glycerophosphotransferase family protein [Psychrobacter celer]|uniref:CDP-glycerol glycerophosphotransferase family protein n=1 Tax=Psychrobacter celer TaxID=306572 RepID=UPI003FD2362C